MQRWRHVGLYGRVRVAADESIRAHGDGYSGGEQQCAVGMCAHSLPSRITGQGRRVFRVQATCRRWTSPFCHVFILIIPFLILEGMCLSGDHYSCDRPHWSQKMRVQCNPLIRESWADSERETKTSEAHVPPPPMSTRSLCTSVFEFCISCRLWPRALDLSRKHETVGVLYFTQGCYVEHYNNFTRGVGLLAARRYHDESTWYRIRFDCIFHVGSAHKGCKKKQSSG